MLFQSPTGILVSDSDEEPVSKLPRLSSGDNQSDRLTDEGSYFECCLDNIIENISTNEDELEELCVMDTSPPPSAESPVPPNTEEESCSEEVVMVVPSEEIAKPVHQRKHNRRSAETDTTDSKTGTTDVNDNHYNITKSSKTSPLGARRSLEDSSKFNRSNRKAPNCATFYFKHHDTDSDQDIVREQIDSDQGRNACLNSEVKSVEDSSEDEWTYKQGSPSPATMNGKSDGSGSSSETNSSIRRHSESKRNSVVVRLDFGNAVNNNGMTNEDTKDEKKDVKGSPGKTHMRKSLETIQRLVSQAEEMVREDASPDKMAAAARAARVFEPLVFGDAGKSCASSQAKYARIKQWLKQHIQEKADAKNLLQPADSCDASGEYTTGDSDEEKESQCSDDMNGSITTCRQLQLIVGGFGSSAEAIPDTETTPVAERNLPLSPEHSGSNTSQVVMRTKRRQTAGERPWSVSGISQLANITPQAGCEPLAQFSISESALHQMLTTTPPSGKCNSGVNLSSSTIGETTLIAAELSNSHSGSLRRRKTRLRKRTLARKSESGSDGVTAGSDSQKLTNSSGVEGSNVRSSGTEGSPRGAARKSSTEFSPRGSLTRSIFKSGSFSGSPMATRKIPERYAKSDPSMLAYTITAGGDMTSETETDEEVPRQRPVPMFKLGPVAGAVSVGMSMCVKRDGDSDTEKNSAVGTEEQLSSFSEQAWDNYQEKYMSEPYSEELAEEAARRLLEFGDDYRNFLDSQSDCASSLSANHASSPIRRRRPTVIPAESSALDSDSDLEEIRHVIHQSRSQLVFSEHVFSKQLAKASPELILASDFAEIVATCRENIRCLRVIMDNVEEEGGLLSAQECKEIKGELQIILFLSSKCSSSTRALQYQRLLVTIISCFHDCQFFSFEHRSM
ncbi:hypothetical protein L9F63_011711, partial [Diploptera punctata]